MITNQMQQQFADRGFIRFDLNDDSLVNAIPDEVQTLWNTGQYTCPNPQQGTWKQCPSVLKLALHPTILEILRQLYGEEPRPFQTLSFKLPSQQLTHVDSVHFSNVEREKMCGVWVALENIDRENGPLMYYPGLHNRWYLNNLDGFESYPDWEQFIQKALEEYEPEYGIMEKGEVIVWSANFLHGGAPAIDLNRTRWSQGTHYYFGNGPFYSPLARKWGDSSASPEPSDGAEWKTVDWIPNGYE